MTHINQVETLIIGAGISGLTTAHVLNKAGRDVMVLEERDQAGGNIQSRSINGWLVEEGPNSLLVNRQQVLDLIQDAGLQDEMLEGNTVSKNRFIYREGDIHPLPGSPWSFIRTPLFSFKDKARLFKEPFIKPSTSEETIAQFVIRRLGQGFYDYAINPFVSGVYAGDPDLLSSRAATRKVYALEEKHGSLVKGALAMVLGKDKPEGRISGRMISFKSGMGALPMKLASNLGEKILCSQKVIGLEGLNGKGWKVVTENQTFEAQRVVLSCSASACARLLGNKDCVQHLENVDYVPIAVFHLGFRKKDLKHALNGFGCLVPRKEGVKLLGSLFSSSMFSGRTPGDDLALLTCFIGGATFRDVVAMSDGDLEAQVIQDLDRLIGVRGEPVFKNVVRYDKSIPQYTLGHLERMREVHQDLQSLQGVSVRANWEGGISVSDCILNSLNHGRSLIS